VGDGDAATRPVSDAESGPRVCYSAYLVSPF
jgi:hypothetical protein